MPTSHHSGRGLDSKTAQHNWITVRDRQNLNKYITVKGRQGRRQTCSRKREKTGGKEMDRLKESGRGR